MRVRFTVAVTVDEELLAEHVETTGGNEYPLVGDAEEWTWDDLKAALDREIAIDVEIVDANVTADVPE
jgi:hypothetical protein